MTPPSAGWQASLMAPEAGWHPCLPVNVAPNRRPGRCRRSRWVHGTLPLTIFVTHWPSMPKRAVCVPLAVKVRSREAIHRDGLLFSASTTWGQAETCRRSPVHHGSGIPGKAVPLAGWAATGAPSRTCNAPGPIQFPSDPSLLERSRSRMDHVPTARLYGPSQSRSTTLCATQRACDSCSRLPSARNCTKRPSPRTAPLSSCTSFARRSSFGCRQPPSRA